MIKNEIDENNRNSTALSVLITFENTKETTLAQKIILPLK